MVSYSNSKSLRQMSAEAYTIAMSIPFNLDPPIAFVVASAREEQIALVEYYSKRAKELEEV